MARLFSCGFELQTVSSSVEFDSTSGTAPTISTTTVNNGLAYTGGAASIEFNPAAATSYLQQQFAATSATNNVYVRFYVNFTAFPGANSITIAAIRSTAAGNNLTIRCNTAGTIYLNNEQASAQVGSTSAALTLNTWYRIEFSYVYSSGLANAYINGLNFASGTANASVATDTFRVGFIDSATGTYYADDVAINDNTGSYQTGLPGPGTITHLHPNGAGDSTQWTPLSGTNWSQVDEVTPDNATSYVSDSLTSNSDFYTIGSSGLNPATNSISLVSVGGTFNNPTADVTTNFKFQVKKASGGTVSQSSSITPNTTTWTTNALSSPRQYPITLYQDPDSINWTTATIGTSQIGAVTGTIGVYGIQLSTVWLLVEYAPLKTRLTNYGRYVSTGNMSRNEVAN